MAGSNVGKAKNWLMGLALTAGMAFPNAGNTQPIKKGKDPDAKKAKTTLVTNPNVALLAEWHADFLEARDGNDSTALVYIREQIAETEKNAGLSDTQKRQARQQGYDKYKEERDKREGPPDEDPEVVAKREEAAKAQQEAQDRDDLQRLYNYQLAVFELEAQKQIALQKSPHYTGVGGTNDPNNDNQTLDKQKNRGKNIRRVVLAGVGGMISGGGDLGERLENAGDEVDDELDNINKDTRNSQRREDRDARSKKRRQDRLEDNHTRAVNAEFADRISTARDRLTGFKEEMNFSDNALKEQYDKALLDAQKKYPGVDIGPDKYVKNTRTPQQRGY